MTREIRRMYGRTVLNPDLRGLQVWLQGYSFDPLGTVGYHASTPEKIQLADIQHRNAVVYS